MKKKLDAAFSEIDKNKELAKTFLDRQAIVVRAIDRRIEANVAQKAALEAEKQQELEKMRDFMELGIVYTHTLDDGYTVSYDNKRKSLIKDTAEFLRWMKNNCSTSEVLTFFEGALKETNIKKFVEKMADRQRANGIMEPKIDGIDIGEVTFRRLTTFYKEKDNAKGK